MSSGFFNVGITGLNAAQAGLLTAGHNISNASTPGFNRQYVVQTSNTPMFTGAGYLGQGTNVQTVKRVYNEFLQKEVRIAETNVAQLETYGSQISQIDSLLSDPSAGLSPALQGFFTAANEAAANPASIPARQAMLSAAQALSARFNSLDQQLTQIRDGANNQIANEIDAINAEVLQLAAINERIAVAQAVAGAQPANDLLDQRDQLVNELNKKIQVAVQLESDGSYSLFFGTGQPLLVGGLPYQLKAQPSPEDLTQMNVALQTPSGDLVSIPESLITGGTLGGVVTFRSQTLDTVQNDLGRIALSLTATINAQHRLGQDIDGNAGGDFFKALSLSIQGAPTNAGTAALAADITVSDYRVSYDGTNYNVTRLSDNTTFTPSTSMPMVIDGIKLTLAAGTPQAGDVFMVKPGAAPSERVTKLQSASNAVLATTGSNLQTLSDSDFRLIATGTGTFSLTRLSDNTTWIGQGASQDAALTDLMKQIAPQGFSLSLTTGTASVGDSFLIRPTRYAARDIALGLADPRNIALAQGFRTGAATTNAGTGTISAGSVSKIDALLASPVKLTYDAASTSLIGFPVGSKLMIDNTVYTITSSIQKVPYVTGQNISFNGTGFILSGVPSDGDSFIVNPPPGGVTAGNNGLTALFGGAIAATNPATGTTVPATATTPIAIVAGANDKFNIAVDGGAATTITLTAGSYTPATLITQIQTQLNATLGVAPPAAGSVTASLDGTNHLVLTSNGGVPSVALSQTSPNLGTGALATGQVTTTTSLPTAPITLTYHKATTAGLPVRLTGFPAGSVVTVTLADGTAREYAMNSADGYTDAANYADYVDFTSGATISFNGMSFTLAGSPTDGDKFTVGPNTSATGDNRNVLAISVLQLNNGMDNGTATYQSAYSAMVSLVGNKAREVTVTLTAQENLVTQGQNTVQSASGVNLDEEAANLMRYQQAYQASAKMLDLSSKLFDLVLGLGR